MLTRKTTTVVLLALALASPASARAWTWPADGPVLRGFDFGGEQYREHGHTGIDVGAAAGAVVVAADAWSYRHAADRRRLRCDAAPPRLDRRQRGRRSRGGRGDRHDRAVRR